jgi:hypothetical protein
LQRGIAPMRVGGMFMDRTMVIGLIVLVVLAIGIYSMSNKNNTLAVGKATISTMQPTSTSGSTQATARGPFTQRGNTMNIVSWFLQYGQTGGSNAVCGNGIIEPGEVCDGGILNCTTTNGNPGTKTCNSTCSGWNACLPSPPFTQGGSTNSIPPWFLQNGYY